MKRRGCRQVRSVTVILYYDDSYNDDYNDDDDDHDDDDYNDDGDTNNDGDSYDDDDRSSYLSIYLVTSGSSMTLLYHLAVCSG